MRARTYDLGNVSGRARIVGPPHLGTMRLVLLAALLAAAPASAQRLGVTGGANFGSLTDARAADLDSSTGYHVGAFAGLAVGTVRVRGSVLYLHAGDATFVCPDNVFCADVVQNVAVDVISVPIDLHLRLPLAVAAVYLGAGPDLRFPINDGRPVFDTNAVNVAASGIVGAEFSNVFLELRYARDVSGYAREIGAVDASPSYKLNTVMVRVGVGI